MPFLVHKEKMQKCSLEMNTLLLRSRDLANRSPYWNLFSIPIWEYKPGPRLLVAYDWIFLFPLIKVVFYLDTLNSQNQEFQVMASETKTAMVICSLISLILIILWLWDTSELQYLIWLSVPVGLYLVQRAFIAFYFRYILHEFGNYVNPTEGKS